MPHLDTGQRAALAAKLKPLYADIAKKNQIRKPVDESVRQDSAEQKRDYSAEDANRANAMVAKTVGVSRESVRQYEKLAQEAPLKHR